MRIARWILISLALVAVVAALAWKYVVPFAIDRELHARLDDAGFAHASFEVGRVALDRVELVDVSLAQGLDLGDVEIAAGPWQLWRGERPDVVLHRPRIAPSGAHPNARGRALPFRRVVIDAGELDVGGDRLAVRGTIDLRAPLAVFDLAAYAPTIHVGPTLVEGMAATIRGPANHLRACGTGLIERARVDACIRRDSDETASLEWRAREVDDNWSANGRGQLTYANESVAFTGGLVEASLAERTIGGFAIEHATVHAEVDGDFGARSFALRGELVAEKLSNKAVTIRGARLPFDVVGVVDQAVKMHSDRELVLSAASAIVTSAGVAVRIERPVVAAHGATSIGDVVELAAGTPDRSFAIVAKLRGISVDRVLAAATGNRVRGTGILDGELVFDLDDRKLALVGGELAARGPGRLLATNPGSLAKVDASSFAVHRRIAAALADFDYTRLALSIDDDPDLRLSLEGRGRRVAQELDVDVNVRGLLARNAGSR
jgi:hypothetical protein